MEMFQIMFVACADDAIGRFDRSMLSQQSLMELFVFGLDNVDRICGSRDDPREVCTWKGVTCNDDGEVEAFDWSMTWRDGTGTLEFNFLPRSMKDLRMHANALSGTIELAGLPENMKGLNLSHNALSGTLDLDDLPSSMEHLRLSDNKFTAP